MPSKRKRKRAPARAKAVSDAPPFEPDVACEEAPAVLPPRQWRSRIVGHGEEDADQLLANPKNWRVHTKFQQDAIEGVLKEVGWVQDVIVNRRSGHVIDGHARIGLAISRGERVPVVYIDVSEAEESIILASLDPISALAGTDKDLLKGLLGDITANDAGLKAFLDGLGEQVGYCPAGPVEGEDDVPEVRPDPISVTGDLWILGQHRVLCGDSTSIDAVDRLMGGEKAALVLTDPPYGIGESKSTKHNYDTYSDTKENLIATIADVMPIVLSVSECVVLTPGNANVRLYPEPTWTMAWFTPAGVGSGPWGFCCWQPILCFGKDPKLSKGKGRHPDAIVHTEAAEDFGHPCTKPIKFWQWLMERTSEVGERIFDPFGGSGTTVIASEKTNRIAYLIELSPQYVDVIVRRWQDFAGKQAILDGDGRTFREIEMERFGRNLGAQDAVKEEVLEAVR